MNLDAARSPLAPGVPEPLIFVTIVLAMAGVLAVLGQSLRLEMRYGRPYTLMRASSDEKWRWAASVGVWQAAVYPILGLAAPVLSPLPDQWLIIPICTGFGLFVMFPFHTVAKRLNMEWQLYLLRRTSQAIRSGRLQGTLTSWAIHPSLFLNHIFDPEGSEEHERFWR